MPTPAQEALQDPGLLDPTNLIPAGGIVKGGAGVVARAVASEAKNLAQQLAIDEAKTGSYEIMKGLIKDTTRPAEFWAKMQYVHECLDGSKIVVHSSINPITGVIQEFKIKWP